MDALWDEDMKMRHYRPILFKLEERILLKHGLHGVSYLERDYDWMLHRLFGELMEFLRNPTMEEALDVTICAVLIADKKRREAEE